MKTSKSHQVTMTVHRVTAKTKAPYLARIKSSGGTAKEPILLWVSEVRKEDNVIPAIGYATVVSGYSNSSFFHTGAQVPINNFRGLERIVFSDVPKSNRLLNITPVVS